jgi:hypothetical protein
MVKFLIALAEMFSAFAAKLHDMSEEAPEYVTSWDVRNIIKEMPDTLDAKDVIEIVKEAIEDGDIITKQECDEILEADDIRDFSSAVNKEIDEYDFDQTLQDYMFKHAVTSMVLAYCETRGIDPRGVYMQSEVYAMDAHFQTRKEKWNEWADKEAERVKRVNIREYVALKDVTVVNPPTIKLGDGSTVVDITNH